MSIVSTYRRYLFQLTAGVDFLRDGLGRLYAGTYGAVADALLEGVRQSFVQSLPGHPEQTVDSLDQVGADRTLFKYRGESLASWTARTLNAWESYEQAGTDIQVKRAVNEWGSIVFASSWNTANVYLVEGVWARFTMFFIGGILPWGPPAVYGTRSYGEPDLLYGLTNVSIEDVSTLVRVVNKWKPKRSRGQAVFVVSGHVYGQPILNYGGGAVYGPAFAFSLDL